MVSNKYWDIEVLRRLMFLAKPYWGSIVLIFVLGLLLVPLALLLPVPLKIVVDSVIGSDDMPSFLVMVLPGSMIKSKTAMLIFAVSLQVMVVFLSHLLSAGQYMLQTYAGENLTLRFREKLFRNCQRLSFSFHDLRGTADSLYRIQHDAPSIQYILIYGLVPVVTSLIMFLFMVYISAWMSFKLASIAFVVIPLLFIVFHIYHLRMRPRYTRVKEMESRVYSIIQENMTAFRVIKAFGREDAELGKFVDHADRTVKQQFSLVFGEGLFGLLVNTIIALGSAAVLFFGVIDVQSGKLTVGGLLIIISYLAQLYDPMKNVSKQVVAMQDSFTGAVRSFELMDEIPDVTEAKHGRAIQRAKGKVEFRNVSFAYAGGNKDILHDISFSVNPNTRVGIVGKNGAGKTTLVSLLPRFYDSKSGKIMLDGINVCDYKLADLNQQFSFVLQESVLFSTSISENIAYAKPCASIEEIVNAAKAAHAHDFIVRLPHGYDTSVGERGMRLSGGERQRIALARAFLRNTSILILDEPTSSVDLETESIILRAMDDLMMDRTVFIISHKLNILSRCDMLLMLDDGRLRNIITNVRDLPNDKYMIDKYEIDISGKNK